MSDNLNISVAFFLCIFALQLSRPRPSLAALPELLSSLCRQRALLFLLPKGKSKGMAKLRDLSHATMYSACLPPSYLHVAETRNVSVVSQKHLRVCCYKFCRALQSFEVAKMRDTEGASTSRVTYLLV